MNPFEMVAIIVVAVMIASVLRAKYGHSRHRGVDADPREHAENARLREEVKELKERIKLLTSENAQLRAEIGSIKDRLETVERIVTDKPHRLAREIDALALDKGGNA